MIRTLMLISYNHVKAQLSLSLSLSYSFLLKLRFFLSHNFIREHPRLEAKQGKLNRLREEARQTEKIRIHLR